MTKISPPERLSYRSANAKPPCASRALAERIAGNPTQDFQLGTKVQDLAAGPMVGEITRFAPHQANGGGSPKDALVLWPNGRTTWVPTRYLTIPAA